MSDFVVEFAKIFPELNVALGAGIMVFSRMAGLFCLAPIFNRKEIPSMIRISLILIFTVIATMLLKPAPAPDGTSLILGIFLNFLFGLLIGFVANCILQAIMAGGDMINMQMGMSSAMVLDPATKQQTSVLGNYFTFIGLIIFISIGGAYWLFDAFLRSFQIFPMYSVNFDIMGVANLEYVTTITANILFMGMQIASPVLLATLGQDIILGIISKTAPQVNVFQLSFLFKPCLGALILTWILPNIIETITTYISSYSNIF
ncbi:MAG: flagellar biosynthetic protein FliR [Cyanobacteria bacterium SIG30]|nr:flagellar biosynthetic protein FliR [Cyanobacteria bacterium SIG30]